MKQLRQPAVELVLGTLLNHMGMRQINIHGLELAHKEMLLTGTAYTLQKLLHLTPRRRQAAVMALPRPAQEGVFCFYFWPDREVAVVKGIEGRGCMSVVQQAHSLFYTPLLLVRSCFASTGRRRWSSRNRPGSGTPLLRRAAQYPQHYTFPSSCRFP